MKTLIIGGGASGMTAAIFSALKGDDVTIIEHNERLGKKILSTGNGRCNLTNRKLSGDIRTHFSELGCADETFYRNIISKFGYEDTIDFFYGLGLMTKERGDLVYPLSDQAGSVLDVLRFKVRDLDVKVLTECHVKDIKRKEDGSFFIVSDKGSFSCDKLIIATGSKAAPQTGSDGSGYEIAKKLGHRINEVRPGLVRLRSKDDFLRQVSGVRSQALLSLFDDDKKICSEEGEIQFTDHGISGIVTMNISNRLHLCGKKPVVHIDLIPNVPAEDFYKELVKRRESFPKRSAEDLVTGTVNKKLGLLSLKLSGIRQDTKAASISDEGLKNLAGHIRDLTVNIEGPDGFMDAQICLGGVDCSELDDGLQSRIVPGLYFCGEILDLHGDCGGYNLQLAWSTGAIAGRA
ncbi:MAG: NAD(P)/FAD-dependent oxidoreductase [Lachnospiraceae bacterium]|nr:NAD(P)/FAD-dependent oxidoreductase [Lachnospiraceae bacterium]